MTLFVLDFGRGKRDPSDASSPGLASQAFERAAHTKSTGQPSGGGPHLSELGGGVKGLPAVARHGKQAAFHHTLLFSTRHLAVRQCWYPGEEEQAERQTDRREKSSHLCRLRGYVWIWM